MVRERRAERKRVKRRCKLAQKSSYLSIREAKGKRENEATLRQTLMAESIKRWSR